MNKLLLRLRGIKLNILFLGISFVFLFLNPNKYLLISEYFLFPMGAIFFSFLIIIKKGTVSSKVEIFIGGILLFAVLIGGINAGNEIGRGVFLSYLLFVLLYLGITAVHISKRELQYLFWCIVAGTFTISLLILVFRVDYFGGGGERFTIQIGGYEAVDPNYLGAYLAFGVSIALGLFLYSKNRIVLGIITGILGVGTLLTGSRGAMLALGISGLFILLQLMQNRKKKKFTVKMLLFIMISVAAVYFIVTHLPPNIFTRFFTTTYIDSSNSRRLMLWRDALGVIKRSWMIGHGCIEDNIIIAKYLGMNEPTHNTYLGIWIQLGIIGIGSIFFLLVKEFIRAVKNKDFILAGMMLNVSLTSVLIGAAYTLTFWGMLILAVLINKYNDANRGNVYET